MDEFLRTQLRELPASRQGLRQPAACCPGGRSPRERSWGLGTLARPAGELGQARLTGRLLGGRGAQRRAPHQGARVCHVLLDTAPQRRGSWLRGPRAARGSPHAGPRAPVAEPSVTQIPWRPLGFRFSLELLRGETRGLRFRFKARLLATPSPRPGAGSWDAGSRAGAGTVGPGPAGHGAHFKQSLDPGTCPLHPSSRRGGARAPAPPPAAPGGSRGALLSAFPRASRAQCQWLLPVPTPRPGPWARSQVLTGQEPEAQRLRDLPKVIASRNGVRGAGGGGAVEAGV